MGFRSRVFLKDVATLAMTSFGGPQVHFTMFHDLFVKKHHYLSEEEYLEIHALCQVIPGPSSTQTITAIAFKFGGANLAYLTLLIWLSPALIIMTSAGLLANYFIAKDLDTNFLRFIQPMAVGLVIYAAYHMITLVVNTRTSGFLLVFSAMVSYYVRTPYALPLLVVLGGVISARKYKHLEREPKEPLNIPWANFFLWGGVFLLAALLGEISQLLPVKLFENFYRNGSLIFGGGQVLIPAMFTEFVVFKKYLSTEQFLSGYAIAQLTPGPVFSFASYISTISMKDYGITGQLLGGLFCGGAIFLPGTFLIFFLVRFWDRLKKYRVVKASLEGIQATSAGLVVSAAILLFEPMDTTLFNIGVIIGTVTIVMLTRISPSLIILGGLIAGVLWPF
jgi:chromate transporter